MSQTRWTIAICALGISLISGCNEDCPESIPALSESTIFTSFDAQAWDIQTAPDGGFVVTGYVADSNTSSARALLVKTTASGTVQWAEEFHGDGATQGRAVQVTDDGGYVVAGNTGAFLLYEGAVYDPSDAFLVKFDALGNLLWSRIIVAGRYTSANALCVDADGDILVAGFTREDNGVEFGEAALLLKFDRDGNEIWRRRYGDGEGSIARDVIATSDGGYVFSGSSIRISSGPYVVKLNSDGDVDWEFQGAANLSEFGVGAGIIEVRAGGYAVIGSSFEDFFVGRLDDVGELVWMTRVAGSPLVSGYDLIETDDGKFVAAGYSENRNSFGLRSCPRTFVARLRGGWSTPVDQTRWQHGL